MQRNRARMQSPYSPWMRYILAIACALVVSLCLAAAVQHESAHAAKSGSSVKTAAVSEFGYSGDVDDFFDKDGNTFGMYRRQEGSSIAFKDGKIVIEHITQNTTIYKGFYLQADISDKKTWDKSKFITRNSSGWLSFTIDPAYAGKAWPIAPVKVSDETATTSKQYYLGIPTLDKIPGYMMTVTFMDGTGKELATVSVPYGQAATPPADPVRKGYEFQGWDKDLSSITQNTTVTAVWAEEGKKNYTVTFEDGFGAKLKTEMVAEGGSATAPADPVHDGFTFNGWKPAKFSNVKENLTVTAQWLNNDEITVNAVLEAINALPSDPKQLLRDTSNEAVAAVAASYSALSDELKAQIPDDKRLHLAKCAIAVLPSDPFDITSSDKTSINTATTIAGSLPAALQKSLDEDVVSSSRTYGRYLENASWALDALRTPNNVTLLPAGTYTGQVASALNWGKIDSARKLGFSVKSITVKGGLITARLEHESNSSQTLFMGGVEYKNLQTDPVEDSYFEIPINLNSTFHFSVKGKNATESTDAIAYEMTVSADESSMVPDPEEAEGDGETGDDEGSQNQDGQDGQNEDSEKSDGSAKADDDSDNKDGDDSGKKDDKKTGDDEPEKSDPAALPADDPNGGGGGGSNTPASTLTASTPTMSSAGNLNSLVRASSVRTAATGTTEAANTGSQTQGSSATSANADSSKTYKNGSGDTRITEIGMADVASAAAKTDLGPVAAGLVLLSVSLGALLFSWGFTRRESANANLGLW